VEEIVKRPEAYVVTETITGLLRSRIFLVDDDFDVVDGDGDLHSVAAGSYLFVVDRPMQEAALVEKLLDASERYFHDLWGHRPHAEPTRTTYDVRTPAGGRRAEAEEVPF
jgi:hypothetical protein